MPVYFDEENRIFNLSTPGTSYIFGLWEGKVPVHIYYGKKIDSTFSVGDVFIRRVRAFSAKCDDIPENDLPLEYPTFGSSDMRVPAFHAIYSDGSCVSKLFYKSHKIIGGKPSLKGLPGCYTENENEADTLLLTLYDKLKNLEVTLQYTVYNDRDIITRSVNIKNNSADNVKIMRAMSMSMDIMSGGEFDFVHLAGAWARERHIQRRPVLSGGQYIDSKRGSSSHHHNPFLCLARKNTDENTGDAFGFALCYSGNFVAGAELNSEELLRTYMGINDFNFCWNLGENEEFQTPEAVMTYSDCGFGKMSGNFHSLIRKRLCRGKFRDSVRPVLINNWEATYFDFDERKILDIAKTAKDVGVELMVLDDGWFGKRNDDTSSLGDWYVNKDKLPDGISALAKKVNKLGMQFGLWFEPEMISPDSDLYRAHPDWAVGIEGRTKSLGRSQLVLDLTREDVCNYIIDFMTKALSEAPISYIKWDMNRNITEPGSLKLEPEKQQEFYHRYILGLYNILETLTHRFPDVLFEGCSGGGGRFDLGMLYYFPQIWTSDDTDAVERMYIQYGTSLCYPTGTMGAHVSAVPNHQVQRVTSIKTRGDIAFAGRFGYELDLATLTTEELDIVSKQIKDYKKWGQIIHNADLYRLKSPFDSNNFAFEFVSEDKNTVIVIYASVMGKPNPAYDILRFKGLEKNTGYRDIESGKIYGSDVLENIGIPMRNYGDFTSQVMIFEKIV